jgi:hypothetical protein
VNKSKSLLEGEEKEKVISLIYSIIPVLCFGIGLFVGYKIKKPDIKNPVTIIKEKIAEHKEQKELIKENE